MEIMKYVLVTGGVISGIGKGVVSSSIGVLLQHSGVPVTAIKIDPYINIGDVLICICITIITQFCAQTDAGTFSPYEHGEVYVLDDGGEVKFFFSPFPNT